MKRRAFLITGGVVGGGLMVAAGGMFYMNKKIREYSGVGMGEGESLNAWVRIRPDNSITIAVPRAEMGQGVYTALPMLIAEELEIALSKVNVIHPQLEGPYANMFAATNTPRSENGKLTMMQKVVAFIPNVITGGSTSIRDGYHHQRKVGAMAREMLIAAAAKQWQVAPENCKAENGSIINSKSGASLTYGALASAAAKEKAPENPRLKPKADFKLVGKPVNRIDVPVKVNGEAEFGLDVRIPNMKFAVIRHPSFVGGKITAIKNRQKVEAMAGIQAVIQVDNNVAVIAKSTWHAKQGALALELAEEQNQEHGDKDPVQTLKTAMQGEPSKVWEDKGDIETVLSKADQIIEAEYEVPYLAHACMEPLNCTVLIDGDKAEVWTGNQSATFVVNGVADGAGISKSNIKINITYLGGGFGRRGETDFVLNAAKVAKAMPGIPIQLVYTREEDMKNDFYRPAVISQLKAGLTKDKILGWEKHIGAQGALSGLFTRNIPLKPMTPEDDPSSTEGIRDLSYEMEAAYTDLTTVELAVSVGTWRSVGHSQNAYFSESFMDECAHALKQDPYELRKSLLKNAPRQAAVLDKVAEISNWGTELPEGKARGLAFHESFGSIVAEVAEIHLTGKNIKLEKVYCVIDCGRIVNPAIIESQMQSGIVYGLTAALYGEISLKNGKIVQNNFPNYQMVKMKTMPEVITHIMDVDEMPGGVGEPGTPPIAPALTNAIFAATGDRIRSLPLSKHGYRFS